MSDEIDTFRDQYDQEMALIKASGNNKTALRMRYEQYQKDERELLNHIKRKTLVQAGRRAAWKYMIGEINER